MSGVKKSDKECRRPHRIYHEFCPAGRPHRMCRVRAECTASGVVSKVSEKDVIVEALVEGGKASGGPPIGPALGPTGVNIFQVVTKINEVTQPFTGLKVPVKIIVNPNDKSFEIEIGTPPTSALILKEVGASKGSGEPSTKFVGNITLDQLKSLAKGKAGDLSALTMKAAIMIITGSCGQMGVTIEGKTAKAFQAEVREGIWDAQLDEPLRE